MRHIVSYAEGGHIQVAIVDEGELTQIGQFIWPDGYGLVEAGLLVSNLSEFFKLNGHQVTRDMTKQQIADAGGFTEQAALPPAPRHPGQTRAGQNESARRDIRVLTYIESHPGCAVRDIAKGLGITGASPSNSWVGKSLKRLVARGVVARHGVGGQADPSNPYTYTAGDSRESEVSPAHYGNKRAKAKPENKVQRFVSDAEVLAVVAEHPEGLSARDIGGHIWVTTDGGVPGHDPPRWLVRSVENRLNTAQARDKAGKGSLPFRIEYREDGRSRNGGPTKYIRPL